MPPARTSKKKATKKSKAAAKAEAEAAPAAPQEAQEIPGDDQMTVDTDISPPEASTSTPAPPAAGGGVSSMVTDAVETVVAEIETVVAEVETAIEKAVEKAADVVEAAEEFVEEMTMEGVETSETSANASAAQSLRQSNSSSSTSTEGDDGEKEGDLNGEDDESKPKPTLEERRAKMEQLRKKMAAGTKANRHALAEESVKAKLTARELARLERQRKLAETLRLKADAEERGEDAERKKNWEYTIEENDEWEKKLARKKRRADYEFHDDAHAARRRYKKDLDLIKPNLEAYNQQKAIAMGFNPAGSNALTAFSATASASSSAIQAVSSEEQRLAADNLYRDANTLIYGDNKPSEAAIDRVVGKINNDIEKKNKFHRKRINEEEGDITYINEHNRVFNKKIARYYDKYTAEIRASFERGTAL